MDKRTGKRSFPSCGIHGYAAIRRDRAVEAPSPAAGGLCRTAGAFKGDQEAGAWDSDIRFSTDYPGAGQGWQRGRTGLL